MPKTKLLLNVLDKSYETTENDDKSFWGSQTIYNISTYWLGTPPKKNNYQLKINRALCTCHVAAHPAHSKPRVGGLGK